MKLKRGLSRFWTFAFRAGLVRAPMPFWRVVVESRLDRRVRAWSRRYEGAVTAVFVWARTIEEAEGLAVLALEEEGLEAVTADAIKCPPAAAPKAAPQAVARSDLGFITNVEDAQPANGSSRRGAQA
ncbi:MAG TPA: hypothetical protein VJ748_09720 [Vitreimonas sp.]|nr:hypothetical protein [Vitreimonas sp.]